MKTDIKRLEDNTIILTITVPWKDVEKIREQTEEEMMKHISTPGFRKGKTPANIAKQKLNIDHVKEEMLKKILPKYYIEAIKQNNLNPLITPRIHVEAFEEGTDLIFTAETCEEPKINLNNYKDEIKKHTAKSKIVIPGKENPPANGKPVLEEIVDIALKSTEVTVPKILIEQETNRLLSQLIDELKSLGLNLDQYLSSRGKTAEDLRKDYEQKAERDLKLEFLLRKIADIEKITVEQKDIDDVLNSLQDEKQKQELTQNKYLLASIIRQQKTLDFLSKI